MTQTQCLCCPHDAATHRPAIGRGGYPCSLCDCASYMAPRPSAEAKLGIIHNAGDSLQNRQSE